MNGSMFPAVVPEPGPITTGPGLWIRARHLTMAPRNDRAWVCGLRIWSVSSNRYSSRASDPVGAGVSPVSLVAIQGAGSRGVVDHGKTNSYVTAARFAFCRSRNGNGRDHDAGDCRQAGQLDPRRQLSTG